MTDSLAKRPRCGHATVVLGETAPRGLVPCGRTTKRSVCSVILCPGVSIDGEIETSKANFGKTCGAVSFSKRRFQVSHDNLKFINIHIHTVHNTFYTTAV